MKSTHVVVCLEFSREFVPNDRDIQHFESLGLCSPKRCRPCRKARRAPRLGTQESVAYEVTKAVR